MVEYSEVFFGIDVAKERAAVAVAESGRQTDIAALADTSGAAIAIDPKDALEPGQISDAMRHGQQNACRPLPMPLLFPTDCTTTASVGTDAIACPAFEPTRWSKKGCDH